MYSYEYNGKRYDFILSMKAKIAIETAQKQQQRAVLGNPAVAKLLQRTGLDLGGDDKSLSTLVKSLEGDQLTELVTLMDEPGTLDPLEVGFLVLSSYPPYRDEVTRDFFNGLVDSMDINRGVEATYEFFQALSDEVFTTLARMQKQQQDKASSRESLLSVVR